MYKNHTGKSPDARMWLKKRQPHSFREHGCHGNGGMGSLHALFVEGLWVQIFHFGAAHAGAPAGIEPGELFHLCGNALQSPYGLGTQADEPAPDDAKASGGVSDAKERL